MMLFKIGAEAGPAGAAIGEGSREDKARTSINELPLPSPRWLLDDLILPWLGQNGTIDMEVSLRLTIKGGKIHASTAGGQIG